MPERSEAGMATPTGSKKLYHERREWGVCTVCGRPKKNGETTVLCNPCKRRRAEYRNANRQRINELCNARRNRHREIGLCIFCDEPAKAGSTRCGYHKEYYAEINKASYERNKAK